VGSEVIKIGGKHLTYNRKTYFKYKVFQLVPVAHWSMHQINKTVVLGSHLHFQTFFNSNKFYYLYFFQYLKQNVEPF